MADFRGRTPRKFKSPEFASYEVRRDKRGGYNIKLNWNYELDNNIAGFKIYKATLSKSLLRKDFIVSQRALEKLSAAKSSKLNSQILYDKNYFVENSKVKFEQERPSRFKIEESIPTKLEYSLLSFVHENGIKKTYDLTDKNIKFGMTYSYVITAIKRNGLETQPSLGLWVNVEDLVPPPCVHEFTAEETAGGILIRFSEPDCDDIEGYIIYRRKVGNANYDKIFEGKLTQKNGVFLDQDIIPGNEFEYKVYVFDFYKNISWTSFVVRKEFKSNFLSKGAIIDPIVNISYEEPYIIIKGERNSDKIIGYRIERQDIWNFETDFEIKEYNGVPWPNVILFDEKNQIELLDAGVDLGKIYKYRISSISKTGKIESIFVSSPIEIGQDIFNKKFADENISAQVKIVDFKVDATHTKQIPIYTKISWKIDGNWDYLTIREETRGEVAKVDNIHEYIFYDKFQKGESLKLKLEVFNLKDEKVAESDFVRILL